MIKDETAAVLSIFILPHPIPAFKFSCVQIEKIQQSSHTLIHQNIHAPRHIAIRRHRRADYRITSRQLQCILQMDLIQWRLADRKNEFPPLF